MYINTYRDIVETVRNLSKRVSGLNAKVSLALALPYEEEASWDQIGIYMYACVHICVRFVSVCMGVCVYI
jgi:hypothetical protein